MSKYIVIPAPGYHGDRITVRSSHATEAAAIKAAGATGAVLVGTDKAKGDVIMRGALQDMVNAGRWQYVAKKQTGLAAH